jgi:tRNA threonylcarbamoyladenosine biosynthesis protein TsaB
MNLLAVDTSSEFCSVAASRDDAVFFRHEPAEQRHGELLIPMIDSVLTEARLALDEVQGIAYGAGPGSFTGLRICCGVAQGLALARGIPVVGVSTLLALAEAACEEARGAEHDRVIACIDARMGEVYHAAYRKARGQWQEVHAPGLYKPNEVPVPREHSWLGCGSGFAAHGESLKSRCGEALIEVRPEILPTARTVLKLALPVFAAGKGEDAATATPVYIRNKVALKTSERR